MNPVIGWTLALIAAALAWQSCGWQGLVFAATVIVFWLLLQFSRALRAMKNAADAPLGHVDSAVMLNAKLKPGMSMLQLLNVTRSLGRKLSADPERYEWADASGAAVTVTLVKGRCTEWQLRRDAEADSGAPAAP